MLVVFVSVTACFLICDARLVRWGSNFDSFQHVSVVPRIKNPNSPVLFTFYHLSSFFCVWLQVNYMYFNMWYFGSDAASSLFVWLLIQNSEIFIFTTSIQYIRSQTSVIGPLGYWSKTYWSTPSYHNLLVAVYSMQSAVMLHLALLNDWEMDRRRRERHLKENLQCNCTKSSPK